VTCSDAPPLPARPFGHTFLGRCAMYARAHTPRSERSSEAPMDFEYTSRPSVTPIWARGADAESRKRPHTASSPFAPPPDPPRFGAGTSNTPFIFSAPPPPPPAPTGWAPPPDFSPAKAFPDVPDVDMAEPQPDAARPVAAGALRRVFRKREARRRAAERVQDVSDEDSDDDDELVPAPKTPRRARIEKHYTVNMSHGVAPQSELPVLLLGYACRAPPRARP
jgi:hypothetical protein